VSSPIAVDFESFFSKKLKYTLRLLIPEQYCSHELFDPYLVSVCDGSTSWSGSPKDLNWEALRGKTLLSHNSRFDQAVYREMLRRGWAPDIKPSAWLCTANLTSFLCNRRSLQESVEYLFGHRVSKDYRGVADGKHWPQDYSEAEQAQVLAAGRSDALWCWRIWDKYSGQWPGVERELSRITVDQGMRGVYIDREKLDTYIWQTHEMRSNTEKVIPWIAESEDESWNEFNTKPTSTKCIAEQCRRVGIPCAPVKSDDEEAYLEWESLYGPKYPWIYAVGAWRSINKLYQTFVTVKERIRDDGTLPFALKYFGAHTGRFSGDARVNMQNMRKRPLVCNEHGLLETNDKRVDLAMDAAAETGKLPGWMRYVIDFRSIVIPRPGKKMIISDLSQIEPRVLAWVVGDWDLLDKVSAGQSVYEAHARATMGFTGEHLDKSSDLYALAKARILALGYGCGSDRFISMAWDLARIDITKDDPEWIESVDPVTQEKTKQSGYGTTSRRIVNEFRSQNPRIIGLWRKLDEGFRQSLGEDFRIQLPGGRKLRYEHVRANIRLEPDPKTGKTRRVNVFTAGVGGKRYSFYGGMLCENLVQATARDVFGEQLVRMDRSGLPILFHCHDEAILEVDREVSAMDIEQEMSFCPDWLKGCPIAAKAKEVTWYCKG
jgi:hypothetical protein